MPRGGSLISVPHFRMAAVFAVFAFLVLGGAGIGFSAAPVISVASEETTTAQDAPDIQGILARCAAYCERLRTAALHFVCEERIVENIYPTRYRMSSMSGTRTITYSSPSPGKPGRYSWRYDYQLIKKGSSIDQKRVLLEFNKKKADPQGEAVKPPRFYSENPVFGPIGFFDKNWHDRYEYIFLKRDRVLDREAIVLKAVPRAAIENKPNFGTVWIDVEDDSILKIEVEDSSLAGYEQVLEAAEKRGLEPDFLTVHEYGVVKNGLRFPSRTLFEERYQGRVAGFLGGTKSKVEIHYENYRFFSVETDAVIK